MPKQSLTFHFTPAEIMKNMSHSNEAHSFVSKASSALKSILLCDDLGYLLENDLGGERRSYFL